MAVVREVFIEALGDDFALVSGQWFEGTRVAASLSKAERLWAFACETEDDVPPLLETLGSECAPVIGIAPGKQPGWEASEAEALAQLLEAEAGGVVGFALAVKPAKCPCPHNKGGCGECTGGCGTKCRAETSS